jgi:UDP-N-acetylmuramyl pentapeptide synthase
LLDIVCPDIGIIAKLDTVHTAYFQDFQALIDEELLLIQSCKRLACINTSEEHAMQIAPSI